MIFKNLRIGWRNIRKNGIFSVINVTGLALGIAVSALILFWVVDELEYDKFHKNIDKLLVPGFDPNSVTLDCVNCYSGFHYMYLTNFINKMYYYFYWVLLCLLAPK